jgi:hypothetical protein
LARLRPTRNTYSPDFEEDVTLLALAGEIEDDEARKQLADYAKFKQMRPTEPVLGKMAQHAQEFRQGMGDIQQERQANQQAQLQAEEELAGQQRQENLTRLNEEREYQDAFKESMDRAYEQSLAADEEAKQFKVDPNAGRIPILDSIAAALGAYGAAMAKTPNFAMQAINKRIDTAIAAQESQLKNLRSDAASKRNRLGMLRERYGDHERAKEAERRITLEQMALQVGDIARNAKREDIRTRAKELQQVTEAEVVQLKGQEKLRQMQIAEVDAANRVQGLRQMQGARAAAIRRQQEWGKPKWQTKGADKMRLRYNRIAGGFLRDKESAREFNNSYLAYKNFDDSLANVEALSKVSGANVPGTDANARLGSAVARTQITAIDAANAGTLDKGLEPLIKGMAPDADGVINPGALARIGQTRKMSRQSFDRFRETRDVIPGQYDVRVDDKGQVREMYQIGQSSQESIDKGRQIQEMTTTGE